MFSDLVYIYLFWLIFFLLGLVNLPLTFLLFRNFVDKGYLFAKILGLVLLSYFVWLLSSLRILPFSQNSILLVALVLTLFNLFLFLKFRKTLLPLHFSTVKLFLFEEILFLMGIFFWSMIRGFEPSIHGLEKFMDFGFVNSILKTSFMPPMDMWLAKSPDYPAFTINYYYFGHYVTALLTKISTLLPEVTYNIMLGVLYAFTFTGAFSLALNLFAFFQKQTGLLKERWVTRGGEPQGRGPELVSRWKGLGAAEWQDPSRPYNRRTIACALLAGFLVALGGNLHTIYAFTKGYGVDTPQPFWQLLGKPNVNGYWYPNATRFIPNTIHEFPIYSFVVSDLHGHVLDIPFVLLTIALLFSLVIKSKCQNPNVKSNPKLKLQNNIKFGFGILNLNWIWDFGFWILLLGLLLAVMYMTNAWDGIIYFGLSGLVLFIINIVPQTTKVVPKKGFSPCLPAGRYFVSRISYFKIPYTKYEIRNTRLFFQLSLVLVFFLLFSLPFNRAFIPFAKGIGINCLTPNSTNQVLCDHSPVWMMAVLWGYFFFFALSFILFTVIPGIKHYCSSEALAKSRTSKWYFSMLRQPADYSKNICLSDIFVTLLIIISTGLLITPEFIFARDIYPAHYRANTMFKLGYQAFMMLGISVAYIFFRFATISPFNPITKTASFLKVLLIKLSRSFWWSLAFIQLFLVAVYPLFAINAYYNGLKTYEGLDGLNWFNKTYPGDYAAVNYLREKIPQDEQPTILEAVGESYTDYARISANTGLPTVVGWPVHEWLWRGSYDEAGKRQEEVRSIYEAQTIEEAKTLLQKYQVRYVIVGSLEIEKYPDLNEQVFQNLGKLVFSKSGTRIYKME